MASCKTILLAVCLVSIWDAALLQDPTLPYAFTSIPQEKQVLEGDDVVFECAFDDTVYTVMWQNDTVPFSMNRNLLFENSRVSIIGSGNTYNLKIKKVNMMDQGPWVCVVPATTTIRQTNQLIVVSPPSIAATPSEDEVEMTEGETLKLSCYADGSPDPVVTWTREGQDLPGGNASFTGETFVVSKIDREDRGTYTCSASNDIDPDVQESFDVEVMWAPTVAVAESIIYSGPGRSVELECTFDSNPAVQVIWQLNNQDLNLEQRTNIESETDGDGTHVLAISDLGDDDFGTYTCKGGNTKGKVDANIVVSALPHSIEFVSSPQGDYSDQYALFWDITSMATPIDCELNIHEVNDGPFSGDSVVPCAVTDGPMHRQSYVVYGLTKNATYHAKVKCRNSFGMSNWTEEFAFFTTPDEMPGPPQPTTVEVPTERPTTTLPPVKSTEQIVEEDDDMTTAAAAIDDDDDDEDDDDGEDKDDGGDGDDDDEDDEDGDDGGIEDVEDNGNTANCLQAGVSSLVTLATALYVCHLRQ